MVKDTLIVYTKKGEKIEIPVHLVKIEFHKGWGIDELPTLILRTQPHNDKEFKGIINLIEKVTNIFSEK